MHRMASLHVSPRLPWLLLPTLVMVACRPTEAPPVAPSAPVPAPPPPAASAPATDPWAGRWNGPEGTYLQITAQGGGRYRIAVRNLDGERSFDGSAGEGGLPPRFERDGQAEQLRPTDGAGTGMKWLDGKRDCLMVRPGEGYCRD